ncbi:MAG: hypothetical protein LBI01_03860 [Elusimicrobium sp.]|nr:hypothetical protein [Elusimicrobium sp.]
MAAIALPQYTKTVEKSRASEAVLNLKAISDAAQRYYLLNGTYVGIDITTTGNLDIEPTLNTSNFIISAGTPSATALAITACRKAASGDTTCTAPGTKYSIVYNLLSGGWGSPARNCNNGSGGSTLCASIQPMLN